jgi:hypothetical protein
MGCRALQSLRQCSGYFPGDKLVMMPARLAPFSVLGRLRPFWPLVRLAVRRYYFRPFFTSIA